MTLQQLGRKQGPVPQPRELNLPAPGRAGRWTLSELPDNGPAQRGLEAGNLLEATRLC